jgi:hypothetical protein
MSPSGTTKCCCASLILQRTMVQYQDFDRGSSSSIRRQMK